MLECCSGIISHKKAPGVCSNSVNKSYSLRDEREYLAVYGRASMAAFRQLSTHIVPPRSNVQEVRLNTHGQKLTMNPP